MACLVKIAYYNRVPARTVIVAIVEPTSALVLLLTKAEFWEPIIAYSSQFSASLSLSYLACILGHFTVHDKPRLSKYARKESRASDLLFKFQIVNCRCKP
jgi:hypothetical protein